ncbi:MAG: hypothetical protein MI673_04745 [Thiotrichales bacterium]|nr:hypothetical protein [Thiotrichales bacterium]
MQNRLNHPVLMSLWDVIVEPLYRAAVLVCFIFLAYPVIFGLENATGILTLLSEGENRTDHLINLVFISSLFLPFIPVAGKWMELILPLQAILCCMMVFSWLAQNHGLTDYSYWPGTIVVLTIILLASFTHWLSVFISKRAGNSLDQHFNVTGFEELTGESIIVFMQAPAILVYSLSLGQQIP